MSKRGEWLGDSSFSGGELSDLPPHLIPENGLLRADNVVLSKTGRLSKRGPVQPYLLTESSDNIFQLGQYQFNNYNALFEGFALGQDSASTNKWYTWSLVNPPSVKRAGTLNAGQNFYGPIANQNLAFGYVAPNGRTPPSFNYLGIPFFPGGPAVDGFFAFAGKNNWNGQPNVSPVVTGSVTVTANDPLISIPSALLPTGQVADYPGNFVYIYLPSATAANRSLYIGVITGAVTGGGLTSVLVYPTPQSSFSGSCYVGVSPYASGPFASRKSTTSPLNLNNAFPPTTEPASVPIRIFTACAHQNRIVCAPAAIDKINSMTASVLPDPTLTENAVVVWSAIAGEPSTASSTRADGILPLQLGGWPANQSVTLETSGIVSLVSMDANNLMVLCNDKTILISGVLGTILPAGGVNTSSFNIRTVSQKVGCLDNLSVQRTPLGVMFASRDGVYVTDGATFKNTMEGKIQFKWNSFVDSISNSVALDSNPITGSALIGETHYVLFTQRGPNFVCNLYNDFSWTTMSIGKSYVNTSVSYGYGVQDWRGRSEVYAPKFLNTPDVNPYCDRIVLLDSILSTDEDIDTDVPKNGSYIDGEFAHSVDAGSPIPVNAEVWTRVYTFGDPSTLKAYKTMTAVYSADEKIGSSDPLRIFYEEGLEPLSSYSGVPKATVASSVPKTTAPMRVSIVPRAIDNGISFGFKTNYARVDSPHPTLSISFCRFSLYQLALNFVGLRKGRTKE